MAESSRATSTLTSESIYHRKKEERAQQYLSGSSRAAYHLNLLLQWSLSMLDISQGSDSGSEGDEEETFRMRRHPKRRLECKGGCPAVLERYPSHMKALESTLARQPVQEEQLSKSEES